MKQVVGKAWAASLGLTLASAAAAAQPADLTPEGCVEAGKRLAAAGRPLAMNTQLVATHFAPTTGRCYVLLTLLADGTDDTPPTTIRTLYRGENGEVLAIASDQAGTRTGLVSDPAHVSPLQDQGYDDALGYIDSKMRFE